MTQTLNVSRYRQGNGREWLRIDFDHFDGSRRKVVLPRQNALNRADLRRELASAGAVLTGNLDISHLETQLGARTGILAEGTGWYGSSFVVAPGVVFGDDDVELSVAVAGRTSFPSSRGTLEEWQRRVAKRAQNSDYVSFAILHALAAPLYKFARSRLQEGAVFHFWAKSSSGKTTAIKAALSVARSPDQLTSWDITDRGVQELAASQNGLQVVLDDTEKIDSSKKWRHLREGVHRLTGGRGKTYSSAVRDSLPDLAFDGWAISNGPDSIEKIFAAGGQLRSDGDRVRMIDIKIPSPKKGGIWSHCLELRGAKAARASELLSAACRDQHGTALVAWADALVANQAALEAKVVRLIDKFVEKQCPSQGDIERRIAQKFGLIFAAGRLAADVGLLPWTVEHSDRVVAKLYRRARGVEQKAVTVADSAKLIWDASRDTTRFPRCPGEQPFRIEPTSHGFVANLNGKKHLYIRKDCLSSLLRQSFVVVVDKMCDQGIALSGHGGKRTLQLRVNLDGKIKKARFVAFSLKALKQAMDL